MVSNVEKLNTIGALKACNQKPEKSTDFPNVKCISIRKYDEELNIWELTLDGNIFGVTKKKLIADKKIIYHGIFFCFLYVRT